MVPGPFGIAELEGVIAAIDRAAAEAQPDQVKVGSRNIRVDGMLDRLPLLASLFTHVPLLRAASDTISGPFRLSAFHLRSVLPQAAAQALHQDVAPGRDGWPLVGFIFMVDAFAAENGATRFVPGSQETGGMPPHWLEKHPMEECACGPAGSMILFDGSVWHGFGANITHKPRRSIYGALIPAGAVPVRDYQNSLPLSVWSQLPALARSILSGTMGERLA